MFDYFYKLGIIYLNEHCPEEAPQPTASSDVKNPEEPTTETPEQENTPLVNSVAMEAAVMPVRGGAINAMVTPWQASRTQPPFDYLAKRILASRQREHEQEKSIGNSQKRVATDGHADGSQFEWPQSNCSEEESGTSVSDNLDPGQCHYFYPAEAIPKLIDVRFGP